MLAPVLSRVTPRLFVKADLDARLLSVDEEVQVAYRNDPLRVAGSTARFACEVFLTMETTSADLERITVPAYVFHGADDELVPATVSRPLAALPNVTYRLWPGLRHECLNEPSQLEVLAEIEGWLDDALDQSRDGSSST